MSDAAYTTDRAAYKALLDAATTPLNPMGGDGIDRCRLCYGELPAHAAFCILPGLLEHESKLAYRNGDFEDLVSQERCEETKDHCRCRYPKGHDGDHRCEHGFWGAA